MTKCTKVGNRIKEIFTNMVEGVSCIIFYGQSPDCVISFRHSDGKNKPKHLCISKIVLFKSFENLGKMMLPPDCTVN